MQKTALPKWRHGYIVSNHKKMKYNQTERKYHCLKPYKHFRSLGGEMSRSKLVVKRLQSEYYDYIEMVC